MDRVYQPSLSIVCLCQHCVYVFSDKEPKCYCFHCLTVTAKAKEHTPRGGCNGN